MISLDSASRVNHAMSGLVVVYSRAFQPGDFVRIGATEGVVRELGALSPKIATPGGEVTIPHGVQIMSPHFVLQPGQPVVVPQSRWHSARAAAHEGGSLQGPRPAVSARRSAYSPGARSRRSAPGWGRAEISGCNSPCRDTESSRSAAMRPRGGTLRAAKGRAHRCSLTTTLPSLVTSSDTHHERSSEMQATLRRFYGLMIEPLVPWTRVLLLVLLIPLALSFTRPLWNIHLVAPDFPQGLDLDIYAHKIDGDIDQINTLNSYIGMSHIDPAEFSDLDWIPFALGGLVLLALRVIAIGDVRSLVDLAVLVTYFSAFSVGRFYYTLHQFGHSLKPHALVAVEPFTPAVLGSQTIAEITTSTYPQGAAWLIFVFALGVWVLAAWHVARGLRGEGAAA